MEMTSNLDIAAFGAACIFVWGAIKAIFRRLSHVRFGREAVARPPAPETRNIVAPSVQQGVQEMLNRAGIVGDFNWRGGRVELPVPPERVHPVAAILGNAVANVQRQPNPNSISVYWRDSVNDRFNILPDLDFDVLREAASIMHRVAEDRRLSTKLYQGLTDQEKHGIARAILYSHWQRRGIHEKATEHRRGQMDESSQHRLVVETIDALYGIKGVKPE